MIFSSVAAIRSHSFVGVYSEDAAAFNAVHAFVCNAFNSVADRAEALRILSDKGMGAGRLGSMTDAALVKHYLLSH